MSVLDVLDGCELPHFDRVDLAGASTSSPCATPETTQQWQGSQLSLLIVLADDACESGDAALTQEQLIMAIAIPVAVAIFIRMVYLW